MADGIKLRDEHRNKLDGIIQKMISNNESEETIQLLVSDFKSKYGEKKKDSLPVVKSGLPLSGNGSNPSQSTKPDRDFKFAGEDVKQFVPIPRTKKEIDGIQARKDDKLTAGLGLTVKSKGLGSSLSNSGGLQQDFTENMTNYRTPSEQRLDGAVNAYAQVQGNELSNEIQNYSQNRPEEILQIKKELGFGESVGNSASNLKVGLQQFIPNTSIAVSQTLENVLGKDFGGAVFEQIAKGDPNVARMEAFQELDELKPLMQHTRGLVESGQKFDVVGLAAATVNSMFSLVRTAITSVPTAGLGLYSDMVGGGIYEYNTTKAQRLGMTVQELYDKKQNDFFAPALFQAAAAKMESIGFKGAKDLIVKNIKGSAFQKSAIIMSGANKEGMTELFQTGIDASQNALALGKTPLEAAQAGFSKMLSKEGLESYLQGVVGTGGIASIKQIGKSVLNPKKKAQVTANIETLERLQTELQNENATEASREFVWENIQNNIKQIVEEVDSDVKESEALTTEQKKEVGKITTKIQSAEEVANDPALSKETKALAEEQVKELEKELTESIKPVAKNQDKSVQTDVQTIEKPQAEVSPIVEGKVTEVKEPVTKTEEKVAEPIAETTEPSIAIFKKAEDDLTALKQVTDKKKKYEASIKRLVEAKKAKLITPTEFDEAKARFDDVLADADIKAPKVEDKPVDEEIQEEPIEEVKAETPKEEAKPVTPKRLQDLQTNLDKLVKSKADIKELGEAEELLFSEIDNFKKGIKDFRKQAKEQGVSVYDNKAILASVDSDISAVEAELNTAKDKLSGYKNNDTKVGSERNREGGFKVSDVNRKNQQGKIDLINKRLQGLKIVKNAVEQNIESKDITQDLGGKFETAVGTSKFMPANISETLKYIREKTGEQLFKGDNPKNLADGFLNYKGLQPTQSKPDSSENPLQKVVTDSGTELTDKDKPLVFVTHNKEEVSGKKLTDALNKVADDWADIHKRIREEDGYASHVSEAKKDENLKAELERAEEIRNGIGLDNFTIWQRIDTELTGETVPFLPKSTKEKSDSGTAEAKKEEPIVSKTKLELAKEARLKAKEELKKAGLQLGIATDPEKQARLLFNYHKALVIEAKEYIVEVGSDIKAFAEHIEEKVTQSLRDAWSEATGEKVFTEKDFEPKEEQSSPNEPTDEELKTLGITKKHARAIREQNGEEQYEYDVKGRAEVLAEAERLMASGFNVPKLISRINKDVNYAPTPSEIELIRQYFVSLAARINKEPTTELLAERKALMETLDLLKTRSGRTVQAFDGFLAVEDNLASFLQDESKHYDLPSEEVKELTEKYNKAQEALEKLQALTDKALEEAKNKKAQSAIDKANRVTNRASVKEDFKAERSQYIADFRQKLKQIRNTPSAVVLPYAREMIALAPFVKNMTASYVKEGIVDLKEIIRKIHEEFVGDIPELTENDIRDILAGEHTNPRQTKNAKLAQIRDLETQARLELKIEQLEAGIVETKNPVQKRVKSDEIVALEKQIRAIQRRNPELTRPSKLQARTTWYKNKIEGLKQEIKEGRFDPIEEPVPLLLSQEALKLKDEYLAFREETRLRRTQKEHDASSKWNKAVEIGKKIIAVKRQVQTSLDLSIPLRQGVSVMMNPRTTVLGLTAYKKMIEQVFSDRNYRRMMFDIKSSPFFLEAKDDGITFSEVGSLNPELRDESHYTESILYDIPYLRQPIKASERAAAAWINYARFELYQRGVKFLQAQGKTRENSKLAYEQMALRVMVDTGRGKIPMISDKTASREGTIIKQGLGMTLYGARLASATFRKLNPLYFFNPKVDKTVRIEAFKDMAGYVSAQILLAFGAIAVGATVSLDWDDPDFLKARWGKKVVDYSAGQSTYIRTFMRLVNAVYNQVDPSVSHQDAVTYSNYAVKSLDNFWRNKLAPNTSYFWNFVRGQNSMGEAFDPYEIFYIYPMYSDDLKEAFKDNPWDMAVILPLGISGLGYQEYMRDFKQARVSNHIKDDDKVIKSFMRKNQLNLLGKINQDVYNVEEGTETKMTPEQSDEYDKVWSEFIISEIKSKVTELNKLGEKKQSWKPKDKEERKPQFQFDKEISKIKTKATEYAKFKISGVTTDYAIVESGDDKYTLSSAQVKERLKFKQDYLDEYGKADLNATKNYNKDLPKAEQQSDAEMELQIHKSADKASGYMILEKYLLDGVVKKDKNGNDLLKLKEKF